MNLKQQRESRELESLNNACRNIERQTALRGLSVQPYQQTDRRCTVQKYVFIYQNVSYGAALDYNFMKQYLYGFRLGAIIANAK